MIPDAYSTLSAGEIAARVKSGRTTAPAMAAAAFSVIDRVEPPLHAFATLARDEALGAAAALGDRIARGERGGALAGVPVAIKDLTRRGHPLPLRLGALCRLRAQSGR